jgi:hypothetical protein
MSYKKKQPPVQNQPSKQQIAHVNKQNEGSRSIQRMMVNVMDNRIDNEKLTKQIRVMRYLRSQYHIFMVV